MFNVVITANAITSLFLIVIIVGLYHVSELAVINTRFFRYCLWLCLLGLICEALSFLLEGKEEYASYLTLVTFLGYFFLPVLIIFYSLYTYQLLKEKRERKYYRFPIYILVFCLIQIVLVIIGTLTGKFFFVKEGILVFGPWNKVMMLIPALCYLFLIVPVLKVYKLYGISSILVLLMLFIFPGSSILIVSFSDTPIRHFYSATALTFEVVYVMLQSKIVDEANINARIYNELSVKDVLTGLRNRRGYENYINELKETDSIGVVFCDVNSLKAVNDNEGHAAGDQRIKDVADILTKNIKDGAVCRISGDEFVCVVKNQREESFIDMMTILSKALRDHDRIASFGYAVGIGSNIHAVVNEAEQMMYADKARYYKETGKERRR